MVHELRRDELTRLHQLPYYPYYGTVDTTILWIVTLAEAYRWNADKSMLDECRSPLEKALAWIDKYGDFDGDGFVEYLTRSPKGLCNQGWKDSGDAIVYPDGSLVEPPIALCEVQGYVYAAWQCAAEIYLVWGESEKDLWCSWGIRTLFTNNQAYNPISYQRGSVWSYDNSIIAAGLKRYGYHQEANQIAEGIFTAASYFEAGRMPELFAGIERQPDIFPVPYLDANIPQAWAAGSIFLLLRTILGLTANAPQQLLKVQPYLPK